MSFSNSKYSVSASTLCNIILVDKHNIDIPEDIHSVEIPPDAASALMFCFSSLIVLCKCWLNVPWLIEWLLTVFISIRRSFCDFLDLVVVSILLTLPPFTTIPSTLQLLYTACNALLIHSISAPTQPQIFALSKSRSRVPHNHVNYNSTTSTYSLAAG